MYAIALVFLGGALGGLIRYHLSSWSVRQWGSAFPWGTLMVNISGSAILGAGAGMLTQPWLAAQWLDHYAPLLIIGLLGSYTTVSSFSLQTLTLLQQGQFSGALLNSLLSLLGCPLLFALGYWLCANEIPHLAAIV